MGLKNTKTTVTSGVEMFPSVYETALGGFTLVITNLAAGATVAQGTPVGFDEVARTATVVKQAVVYEQAASSAIAWKVLKGHHFKVADKIGSVVGGSSREITSITTSNAAYDTINTAGGKTLAVQLEVGDVIFSSSGADGTDTAALNLAPKGLLFNEVLAEANTSVSVLIRGTVYKRRIPTGISAAVEAALPLINFSESK